MGLKKAGGKRPAIRPFLSPTTILRMAVREQNLAVLYSRPCENDGHDAPVFRDCIVLAVLPDGTMMIELTRADRRAKRLPKPTDVQGEANYANL